MSRSNSLRNESTDSSVALVAEEACKSLPLVSFLVDVGDGEEVTCNLDATLRSPLFPLVSVAIFGVLSWNG